MEDVIFRPFWGGVSGVVKAVLKTAEKPQHSPPSMTTLKRPTPSTLEEWEHFPTLNDDTAQIRLARAMGYPPGWRVVRTLIQVPIPNYLARKMVGVDSDGSSSGGTTMMAVKDRIYAGDPASLPDGYYNHAAALEASAKFPWRPEYDDVIWHNNDDDYDDNEYCSTSHRNKGGQLKGREAQFEEGDVVQVLYDEDEDEEPVWYEATVLKKIEYQDDIRYNIHYHADDAVQNNVREEKIRATTKTKSKKKKAKKQKRSSSVLEDIDSPDPTPKKKPRRPKGSANKKSPATAVAKKSPKKAGRPMKKVEYTAEQLSAAKEMGLPRGWAVIKEGDFSSIMKDPEGKKYKTQKAAFAAAAGMETQTSGRKRKAKEVVVVDEGDPPWRTSGHEYLSRQIQWTGLTGTVTGWISETDVDSNGEPGFVCNNTGKPARLFHAVFDDFEQDFEEFELEECLV